MRQSLFSSFSLSSSHINSDSLLNYDHIDFGSQTQNLPLTESSFLFHYCTWDNCLSEPAGAISCSQSITSLIVMHCKFNNCNSTLGTTATQAYNGGAICVVGINTLIVSSSLFFNCRAPQTNHDNGGSGGICIRSIKKVLTIYSSDFISCFTGSSGAGVDFETSSRPKLDLEIIVDCRCIQCRSQDTSPDGGGMCLFDYVETLKCIGCLFSSCTTTGSGGGFDFYFGTNSESYPIKYCFFMGNTASSSGNDLYFWNLLPASGYLAMKDCFSKSASYRIGYRVGTGSSRSDNWLL